MTAGQPAGAVSGDERERSAEGLAKAKLLARAGFPIFLSTSELHETEPGEWGWNYPGAWQQTRPGRPSLAAIGRWKPGYALCMVGGVAGDFIDIDAQHGGHLDDVPPELAKRAVVAIQRTPSGGWHLVTHLLGVASSSDPGRGVDIRAGLPDGSGRGFIHIAPTVGVSKVDGERRPYQWIS